MDIPSVNLTVIAPELALTITALLLLGLGAFFHKIKRGWLSLLGLIGIAWAFVYSIQLWDQEWLGFNGMMAIDNYTLAFNFIFLTGVALTFLFSLNRIEGDYAPYSEYFALVLLATVGMMLMASGTNLMIIFLGLEVLSLSLYVLAGIRRQQASSVEAAFKYFLLGAFSTGFLLYGIALLYGVTGTLDLKGVGYILSQPGKLSSPLVFLSLALLIVGFGFKVALVPFHMWAPDVYQGAPTPITGFMSAGTKAAAFAALVRILVAAFGAHQLNWSNILWVLAVFTMTLGNVVAISQSNIKRMLAYSSIAHAGYILVAVVAANDMGHSGILFYLMAYTFMNVGAFGVVIMIGAKGEENLEIADYMGLGYRRPLTALAMAVFMFSLAGIPPTAGFMGKFYIFSAALKAGYLWLVIFAVINSLISVYYYLRVVVYMYMREPEKEPVFAKAVPAVALALLIAVVGTLQLGIFPSTLMEIFQNSVKALM
ncbi:MAG: NADH-quinone oxidoreductase subunit N [candidate division KSB1 bacterium]|nr:NADH-quinone oxidoreductase subunit N [candidate division KSB1 bacterium]